MKKLTKKARHLIYITAEEIYRQQVIDNDYWGICYAISHAIKIMMKDSTVLEKYNYADITPYDNIKLYTEVYEHKPPMAMDNGYWFDLQNTEVRLNIFKEVIKKTK